MDGTANPHLAIAAIATAGLLGLRHGSRLPPPFRGNPAKLPEQVWASFPCENLRDPIVQLCHCAPLSCSSDFDDLCIPQTDIRRLPSSLGMAVDSLFDDTGVQFTVAMAVRAHAALRCSSDHEGHST
jgi:Glutamine synthetase, catalytic domain